MEDFWGSLGPCCGMFEGPWAGIASPHALSQVPLPEGFRQLPFSCNSQMLCVRETLKDISLFACKEAEEQRGFGIRPNHTAH